MPTQNVLKNQSPSFFSMIIKWWFSITPKNIYFGTMQVIVNTFNFFSIPQLIKTLFEPWRRDIYSSKNLSLQQQLQLGIMNLVSRFVGAIVRLVTVITGFIIITLEFIIGIIFMFVFILAPIIGIFFFLLSFL